MGMISRDPVAPDKAGVRRPPATPPSILSRPVPRLALLGLALIGLGWALSDDLGRVEAASFVGGAAWYVALMVVLRRLSLSDRVWIMAPAMLLLSYGGVAGLFLGLLLLFTLLSAPDISLLAFGGIAVGASGTLAATRYLAAVRAELSDD